MDGNNSEQDQPQQVREITQTDHLNARLLSMSCLTADSFKQHLESGAINVNNEDVESDWPEDDE